MDGKGKEKGILKMDLKPKIQTDPGAELNTQKSLEHAPVSPQPSVDRLSVTWADPESMASTVNLFHMPTDTAFSNDVKFTPNAGEGSEESDYSASLSAVLRQRRASVRRSRKSRGSEAFIHDEPRTRRRSSVFTTSSGDTAISLEDVQPLSVTQDQIFENIHLHKEVLGSVKQQPLGMRRKLKIVHQAKTYIKRHEGQLQERLAQSKSTRDIYARFNILLATKWQQLKREAANTSNLMIPWELRIKKIESHFGSVVASYFTFLRWLFWVNLVIAFVLVVFVVVPEILTSDSKEDYERKNIMEDERRNATNLLTLWNFEGVLKYSPIFYGFYSNVERPAYRMPLAYFLTGLAVYIYSFVATLRKMAENSRMSKLSEKGDECIFSWKLFTGWDFMIGNAETAHNRIASVILGFKEVLLEEAEKKKDLKNWRFITFRVLVFICVIVLLVVSAYAVVTVVSRSDDNTKVRNWWRENETTMVMTGISITFPWLFELLGYLENYHPRRQLRFQLARIMVLNLLNLYSLIFALFSKIENMSKELDCLKPTLSMNASLMSDIVSNQPIIDHLPMTCIEIPVPCPILCNIIFASSSNIRKNSFKNIPTTSHINSKVYDMTTSTMQSQVDFFSIDTHTTINPELHPENLIQNKLDAVNDANVLIDIDFLQKELEKIRNISSTTFLDQSLSESTEDISDYSFNDDDIFFWTNISGSDNDMNTKNESTWLDLNVTETTTENNLNYTSGDFTFTDENNFNSSDDFKNSSMFTNYPNTTNSVDHTKVTPSIKLEKIDLSTGVTWEENTESSSITSDVFSFREIKPRTSTFMCPDIINCTSRCGSKNITQIYFIEDCVIIKIICFSVKCGPLQVNKTEDPTHSNGTAIDFVYFDENNRKMYNLTVGTKKKLLKLCWETMFGQELVKLTIMDLVFVVLGTLLMDFFRALFVRYFHRFWCWDLEKKFPAYGDFKIAENILHLINNQGMVWMGMFFSPGLVILNVFKLIIMMYLRSWAVMTCNVPHEVVFRVSKSNNFYLALLLTMLFLCVLPVGYTIVWVKPSWHCGPFSEYPKIYHILTNNIYKILPKRLNFALEYITSPATVIPLLVLIILIIYYLTSLTNSLREANNDLKIQLRRERTEERRKMFQIADTRRRVGSSAMDNTPFARWKRALPSLPLGKSIDSDDRKTPGEENTSTQKVTKKRGGIFAKIVGMALDKKSEVEIVSEVDNNGSSSPYNIDEETDTDFHETLPKEILKIKDVFITKTTDAKRKLDIISDNNDHNISSKNPKNETKFVIELETKTRNEEKLNENQPEVENKIKLNRARLINITKKITENKLDQQSLKPDAVIPVITISATESDEENLQPHTRNKSDSSNDSSQYEECKNKKRNISLKALRRQSSVDSITGVKSSKGNYPEHSKVQHSL